jgi:hypothetical protein
MGVGWRSLRRKNSLFLVLISSVNGFGAGWLYAARDWRTSHSKKNATHARYNKGKKKVFF